MQKKRAKIDEDDMLRAILHLDMKHIGVVDIDVRLSREMVSTNFQVQDTKILDFIEEQLPKLDQILEKKGYQVKSSVAVAEGPVSSTSRFEPAKVSDDYYLVSNQSFDARA